MEKRLGVTLKQSYVNKITAMLDLGMIPPGNSDLIHRFLLGKTRPGSEIRMWKNQSWDGYCKQCCKEKENLAHIFDTLNSSHFNLFHFLAANTWPGSYTLSATYVNLWGPRTF